ncbi:class I SAM-dependent methyltransferase [bacterium]|nr:class I SAM-dependent methyltransferase [bacterium]
MLNNYDRIADLYDLYVTADYDIAFWKKECAGVDKVLEITAGTGRVTLPLLREGVRITAVDVAYHQLERLRNKAREAKLEVETVVSDMRELELGRTFPLVIIPFQSLQELTDSCDVTATLRGVRAHIGEGGRAIITLHNPGKQDTVAARALRLVTDTEMKNGNRMLFWNARTFDAETNVGTSYQLYEEYDVDGVLHRKRIFTPRYRVYAKDEFAELASRANLRISNEWGGYDWSPLTDDSCFMIFELVSA